MNPIILSICIATRNRGAYIGATLGSIVSQATDEVEIIVLDGASTDNTEEVVRFWEQRFPRLRYFRQPTAMGIDRDFAKAVELARGKYCWLFCDDDLLKSGAIRVVLDALKADYALVIVNSEVWNADLSELLEPRRLLLNANRVYRSDQNDLLLIENGDYLTFIGCVVIKRELWDSRSKEKYFGSCFIHVGVIFQQSLPSDALAIAEPLVTIRYANASWLGRYFEIWMFRWPELIWSFTDFSDSVKHRVCRREPWRDQKTLLHLRAKGAYTKKEYAELVKPRLASNWARAVSKASAYFPGRFANLLAFLYYSTLRHPSERLQILSDLANSSFCFWKLPAKYRTLLKRAPLC